MLSGTDGLMKPVKLMVINMLYIATTSEVAAS